MHAIRNRFRDAPRAAGAGGVTEGGGRREAGGGMVVGGKRMGIFESAKFHPWDCGTLIPCPDTHSQEETVVAALMMVQDVQEKEKRHGEHGEHRQ